MTQETHDTYKRCKLHQGDKCRGKKDPCDSGKCMLPLMGIAAARLKNIKHPSDGWRNVESAAQSLLTERSN